MMLVRDHRLPIHLNKWFNPSKIPKKRGRGDIMDIAKIALNLVETVTTMNPSNGVYEVFCGYSNFL
jgi:hypothetical protein